MKTKLITCLILIIYSYTFSQEKSAIIEEQESSDPLTNEEFNLAVKKDFNALIGNDENSLKTALTTNFDKEKSTVSGKFLVSPKFMNKKGYKNILSGKVEFGESNNIFDIAKSNMPLVNLTIEYTYLPYKSWFYIKKDNNTVWTHKRYFWINSSFSYKNNKYKIFDITKPFSDQLYNETYDSFSGKIGLNFYANWNNKEFDFNGIRPNLFYFNLNYEYLRGNNISKFNKVTVKDYQEIIENQTFREVYTETTAYKGNYKIYNQHLISSEVLFGVHENIIIDIFNNYQIGADEKPIISYGTGLYFLVKNDKKDNVVNFGLFIMKEAQKDPFIGFKTSLPLNF